jgi:hypothetical protein
VIGVDAARLRGARRVRPRRARLIAASAPSSSAVACSPAGRGAPTGDGTSAAPAAAIVSVAPGRSCTPSSRAFTCARTMP